MLFNVFDIETSNLNADYGFTICAVTKMFPNGRPKVFRIDNYKGWFSKKYDDRDLLGHLIQELNQGDGIITYNGLRFDVPFINSQSLFYRLPRLKRLFHLDLCPKVRWEMKLHNARLGTLIEYLNSQEAQRDKENFKPITEKTHINNLNYKRAVTGDKKGIDYMVDHCIRDVESLSELYGMMRDMFTFMRR